MALGHFGMYEEWCKTFDPEQHKGEISELLVNVPEIRALYAKLVCLTLFYFLYYDFCGSKGTYSSWESLIQHLVQAVC